MEHYVGLDVSLKLTAICIVDRSGKIEREGVVTSDPETIAAFVKSHAPHVARIGLEAGATSTWLWTELNKMGLPVICIDARHAKAALKMQINKSDRNDAVGIARIMQCILNIPLDLDKQSSADKQGFDRMTVEIFDADFLVSNLGTWRLQVLLRGPASAGRSAELFRDPGHRGHC